MIKKTDFQDFYDDIDVPVLACSADGHIKSYNPKAKQELNIKESFWINTLNISENQKLILQKKWYCKLDELPGPMKFKIDHKDKENSIIVKPHFLTGSKIVSHFIISIYAKEKINTCEHKKDNKLLHKYFNRMHAICDINLKSHKEFGCLFSDKTDKNWLEKLSSYDSKKLLEQYNSFLKEKKSTMNYSAAKNDLIITIIKVSKKDVKAVGGEVLIEINKITNKNETERENIELTKQFTNTINAIKAGNLSFRVKSEWQDHPKLQLCNQVLTSLQRQQESLCGLCDDIANKGQLGHLWYELESNGDWKLLHDSVNHLSNTLTNQIRNIGKVAKAVSEGDLSQKVSIEAHGELAEIKQTINNMVDNLNTLAHELISVAHGVGTEGVLGLNANVPDAKGMWREAVYNINRMADNLTSQVREVIDVMQSVASGNLNKEVQLDSQGEVLILKNTINDMVTQLRAFSAQVIFVAKKVGLEGQLGLQAMVHGAKGTWKDMVENVNVMANNLTIQVREITQYAEKLSRGYLKAEFNIQSPGELRNLVYALNDLRDTDIKILNQAQQLLAGDFSVNLVSRGKYDELSSTLIGMINDIKDNTIKLSDQKKLLDEFLENSTDVFSRHDYKWPFNCIMTSSVIEEILELNVFEFTDNSWRKHIHKDDISDIDNYLKSIVNTASDKQQHAQAISYRMKHKNGHYENFETKAWLVCEENNKPKEIHMISRCITGRVLSEEKEQIQQHQLQKVIRMSMLQETTTGIAHQLTQPLAIVQMELSRIKDNNIKFDDSEVEKSIIKVLDHTKRMGEIIHTVKNLYSQKPGKKIVTNHDPEKIIIKSIESAKAYVAAANKNIWDDINLTSDINLPSDNQFMLQINPVHLELVFNNLISNSVDELNKLNKSNKQIHINTSFKNNCLIIRFSDNGNGVPYHIKDSIFEHFFTTKEEGSGVGLSLIKTILESHLGTIKLLSQTEITENKLNINTGCCFEIVWPITISTSIHQAKINEPMV